MNAIVTPIESKRSQIKFDYYSFDKVYSYNAPYNFICGGRGLGKTFGAKKKVLKKAIHKKEQFIYLRRFKEELAMAKSTFFSDIEHLYPNYDFRVNGFVAEMAHESSRGKKRRNWTTIGYFVALTGAQKMKSVSFDKVTTIIFDEFIIEPGATHYLPSEDVVFNNFYSTVDRYKDKTKVLFLANAVSIMNPYFLEWNIRPPEDGELVILKNGFIVAHFPKAENFNKQVYKTRFGAFIEGTEYADYAVANQFSDNNDTLIEVKGYRARYQFTLECTNGTFSVWHDMVNDRFYAQAKLPGDQQIFTLLPERMDEDKVLMNFNDKPLQVLRTAFRQGRMLFDAPSTRNAFYEVFKR